MWSLKETFGLFQKENPHVKICLSKFCSLRPKNVLLESAMPRQVFLCQYHDNMKMLCDCLSKEISSFPSYSRSIVDHFVCDSNNEEYMAGKCVTCPTWLDAVKENAPLAAVGKSIPSSAVKREAKTCDKDGETDQRGNCKGSLELS